MVEYQPTIKNILSRIFYFVCSFVLAVICSVIIIQISTNNFFFVKKIFDVDICFGKEKNIE